MTRLVFDGCYTYADVLNKGTHATASDSGCTVSFNGCTSEDDGVLCLSISSSTVDRRISEGHDILDCDISIDGLHEIEMLHSYLGLLIDQHKSLSSN